MAFVEFLFGGDEASQSVTLWQYAFRAGFVYLFGLFLLRLGRNRFLGTITLFDGLLVIILGAVLSRAINGTARLSSAVASGLAIFAIHWTFSWACCRYHFLGGILKGKPVVLIENGIFHQKNMRLLHLSETDVMEQVRIVSNLGDVAQVAQAHLERNGTISVVKRNTPS